MGNNNSSSSSEAQLQPHRDYAENPLAGLALLTKCARVFDEFNCCVDKVLTTAKPPVDPNQYVGGKLMSKIQEHANDSQWTEDVGPRIGTECMPLLTSLQECLGNKEYEHEITSMALNALDTTKELQKDQCKREWKHLRKCRNKHDGHDADCKFEIQKGASCAAGVLCKEMKSEYRTSKRQYLF